MSKAGMIYEGSYKDQCLITSSKRPAKYVCSTRDISEDYPPELT